MARIPGDCIGLDTVPSIDLYRELEVDPYATQETIDAAWRSLVKRHHPDVAPDRAAAIEKIKRINLAHDWLADPRLREMYDLTRYRRRQPDIGPAEPTRPAPPTPARTGEPPARRATAPSQRSTILSASIVALLLVGALVTVALGPRRGGTDAGGVAAATARPPLSSLTAGGGASVVQPPAGLPDFTRDLPAECDVPGQGQPFTFELTVDDLPARAFYARCGADRTWGPLIYVAGRAGWEPRTPGRLETAFPKDVIARSISGAKNEFGLIWTVGDGVDTWLVLYRVDGTKLVPVWSSLGDGIERWGLAEFTFAPNAAETGGSITVRFADMATGSCRTCPDHEIYEETYEWVAARQALVLQYRQSAGRGKP